MSIRFILQSNKTPSHALITCTPWTRWLTETGSPSGTGHVISEEMTLRKTTGQFSITTRIKVKQLNAEPTKAERYLDASSWWLRRTPFGVEQRRVKVIAQTFEGSLVGVDEWDVTSLGLNSPRYDAMRVSIMKHEAALRGEKKMFVCLATSRNPLISLESLDPLPVNLKELRLRGIEVSDFTLLHHLEILAVCNSEFVRDISGLSGC